MKKIFGILVTLSFISTSFLSCDKDDSNNIQSDKSENMNFNQISNAVSNSNATNKYYIFYAEFDWGRDSKDCESWGICNYYDCWFCDVPSANTATIVINDDNKKGDFIIKLDPSVNIQNEAIINKKELYVDNDIITKLTTLHKGVYQFDNTIGNYGGYKLNITKN
jgi:hypothetical protein